MSKRNERELIVGLDIGTSKVVAIVAAPILDAGPNENQLEIIGIGSHPARGMKKGVPRWPTVSAFGWACRPASILASTWAHCPPKA